MAQHNHYNNKTTFGHMLTLKKKKSSHWIGPSLEIVVPSLPTSHLQNVFLPLFSLILQWRLCPILSYFRHHQPIATVPHFKTIDQITPFHTTRKSLKNSSTCDQLLC